MTEFMKCSGRKMELSTVYSHNKATGGPSLRPLNLFSFLHSFVDWLFLVSRSDPHGTMITLDATIAEVKGTVPHKVQCEPRCQGRPV